MTKAAHSWRERKYKRDGEPNSNGSRQMICWKKRQDTLKTKRERATAMERDITPNLKRRRNPGGGGSRQKERRSLGQCTKDRKNDTAETKRSVTLRKGEKPVREKRGEMENEGKKCEKRLGDASGKKKKSLLGKVPIKRDRLFAGRGRKISGNEK